MSSTATSLVFIAYYELPKATQWKQDSAVSGLHWRTSDPVLIRMDNLVGQLENPGDDCQRKYLLAELYYAANYWLRNRKTTPGMLEGREPAVGALLKCVSAKLSTALGCAPGLVGAELQKHYGCSLAHHGIYVDAGDKTHYLTKPEGRQSYKLFFVRGKAMWYGWWSSAQNHLIPVNTGKAYDDTKDDDKGTLGGLGQGWGYFVMDLYRDIYIAPHEKVKSKYSKPKFHSSMLAGQAVQCAGSMLVVEGVIKEIAIDSGHYKPNESFYLNILEHLNTVGVNLDKVKLYDKANNLIDERGTEYLRLLKNKGAWAKVQERKAWIAKQRSANTPALRGSLFQERIKELQTAKKPDPDPLYTVFVERYNALNQQAPWEQVWKGVLDDLIQLDPLFKAKKQQYESHPPRKPRPLREPPPPPTPS